MDDEIDLFIHQYEGSGAFAHAVGLAIWQLRIALHGEGISSFEQLTALRAKHQSWDITIDVSPSDRRPIDQRLLRDHPDFLRCATLINAWEHMVRAIKLLVNPESIYRSEDGDSDREARFSESVCKDVATHLIMDALYELGQHKLYVGHEKWFSSTPMAREGGIAAGKKFKSAQEMACDIANERWNEQGEDLRISEMAKSISEAINVDYTALGLDKPIEISTVRTYIRAVAPDRAKRGGAPKKK